MSSSHTVFCFCNLLTVKEVAQNRKIVSNSKCGHVFHGDCLVQWIKLNKALVAPDDIRCPRCPEKLSTDSRELLLDVGFSDAEKVEFKTKIGAAEIKILLGIMYDQFEGKIALLTPNWTDLSPIFRDELMTYNKSKNLQQIIESGDGNNCELVRVAIDEYVEAISHSHNNGGKFCWDLLGKSLQEELLQKLRRSSGLARLELRQVPLTPNAFKLLLKDNDDDETLLATVISSYIADMGDDSYDVIKSVCDLLLHQWFLESLHTSSWLQTPRNSTKLLKLGILERKIVDEKEKFVFVHDSVEHYFIGMIGSRAMELFKYKKTNTVLIKRQDYFSKYFLDYFLGIVTAIRTQDDCISNAFHDLRTKSIYVRSLMACVITKTHNEKVLELAIAYYEANINKDLLRQHFTISIKNIVYSDLSFLHLAAISGNLSAVKLLTRYLNTTSTFIWDPLIILLLQNTSSCGDDVIERREEVIEELLKYNKNLFNTRYNMQNRGQITRNITGCTSGTQPYVSPITPLFLNNIHVELIKLGLQNGANILTQECSNLHTVVHMAASYMNPDHFHDLVEWLVQNGHSNVLTLKNDERKTALDIAKSRMKVKPETVKLFNDLENE